MYTYLQNTSAKYFPAGVYTSLQNTSLLACTLICKTLLCWRVHFSAKQEGRGQGHETVARLARAGWPGHGNKRGLMTAPSGAGGRGDGAEHALPPSLRPSPCPSVPPSLALSLRPSVPRPVPSDPSRPADWVSRARASGSDRSDGHRRGNTVTVWRGLGRGWGEGGLQCQREKVGVGKVGAVGVG